MQIQLEHKGQQYIADLSKPLDISIPLKEGSNNPNCYYARDVVFKTIKSGDFVGSVAEGGSVNYQEITMTPHGNCTHTETYGHISAQKDATIENLHKQFHCIAQLITVEPISNKNGDLVIGLSSLKNKIEDEIEAIIIRTLPNNESKKLNQYSGTNPPYLHHELSDLFKNKKIKNLLIDLPSIDKEVDGGALLAHKTFWGLPNAVRTECTVTELIFVDNQITDGMYLLNLQTLNIAIDASPSRPVIYKLDLT